MHANKTLQPEPIHANYDPLNQLAKRYLRLEKQSPDPSALYLIQLAHWGLDALHLKNKMWQSDLRQSVESLLTWDPEDALTYLRDNPDDPHSPLLAKRLLRKAMSGKQAARVILNALDLKMTADQQVDYPPTKYRTG